MTEQINTRTMPEHDPHHQHTMPTQLPSSSSSSVLTTVILCPEDLTGCRGFHPSAEEGPAKTEAGQCRTDSKNSFRLMSSKTNSDGYNGMCSCAETGLRCHCASRKATKWQLCLPRNEPWWPCVKKSGLVTLATIPLIFLVIYITLYYIV